MQTSLNTKYRPDDFAGVIGQDHVVKSLRKVVADKRAKTFIFTGPAGTGKTTLARILAKEFAGGTLTATNIDEVAAANNTGVNEMRDVVARSMYRAIGSSPIKAIILDEAHRLSGNAWDVLLKPIEEPPTHVYWMICTTNGGKIPETVKTRCLQYALKPVPEAMLLDLIVEVADKEKLPTPDEVLEAIAEGSKGSPRQALVYLEACAHSKTAAEARSTMQTAGQSKEVIDLCRWLVKGQALTWTEAIKYVKALEGTDAESTRIVVVNYLSAVLMSSKSDKQAASLLRLMEAFAGPYNTSDRLAPLLNSLGLALRLDQ